MIPSRLLAALPEPLQNGAAWRRILLVAAISFPPALGLRFLLYAWLVPDLAEQAQMSLRQQKSAPISESLREILNDPDFAPVKTQSHPMLAQPSIDFTLLDDRRSLIRLKECGQGKPVVLVFYYGYHCSHCVSQLFGINEDIQLFRELGAEVIAVSADPPEETADRFEQYGRFDFPVVSDPGNELATLYGVYQPASQESEARLEHGTFLIDATGRIHWAYRGAEPFVDNKTLLIEIANRNFPFRRRSVASLEADVAQQATGRVGF